MYYAVQGQHLNKSLQLTLLNEFILKSQKLLKDHPVNFRKDRMGCLQPTASGHGLPGYKPQMPTLKEMYGIKNQLLYLQSIWFRELGVYAGMEVINVEGATGLYIHKL
jgi:2,3-bisphosphoglycerate-independent phosphoglycerate mutase